MWCEIILCAESFILCWPWVILVYGVFLKRKIVNCKHLSAPVLRNWKTSFLTSCFFTWVKSNQHLSYRYFLRSRSNYGLGGLFWNAERRECSCREWTEPWDSCRKRTRFFFPLQTEDSSNPFLTQRQALSFACIAEHSSHITWEMNWNKSVLKYLVLICLLIS